MTVLCCQTGEFMSKTELYLDDRRIRSTFVMSLVFKNHRQDVPEQGCPANTFFWDRPLYAGVNFKLMHPLNWAVNPDHTLAVTPGLKLNSHAFVGMVL